MAILNSSRESLCAVEVLCVPRIHLLLLLGLLFWLQATNAATLGGPPIVELINEADLVVVGTIVSERPSSPHILGLGSGISVPCVLGTLQIDEVLLGELPDGPIEVEYEVKPLTTGSQCYDVGASGVWILALRPGMNFYEADIPREFMPLRARVFVEDALTHKPFPVVDGLQLRAHRDKPAYDVGEEIWLSLSLKNLGTAEIPVKLGADYFNFVVRGLDGGVSTFNIPSGPERTDKLEPGEAKLSLGFGYGSVRMPSQYFSAPGEYQVQVVYSNLMARNALVIKSDWIEVRVSRH